MNGKWSKENFIEYHSKNPELYALFCVFAKQAAAFKKRYSAKAIFHRVRWETMVSGDGEYKIDDGWISHYARKFLEDHPEYEGFFETRLRSNSYHSGEE